MTVEIRELIIRATVVAAEPAAPSAAELRQINNDIIRECVERVLEQLDHAGQR